MQIGDLIVDTSELQTRRTLTDGGEYFLYASGDAITEYPDGAMVVDQNDKRYYFNADGDPVSSFELIHVSSAGYNKPKKDAAWFWLVAALVAFNIE